MKVLYQPSTSTPGDWLEMEADRWSELATTIQPNRLCVQGVEFCADHYHVEGLPDGACRVVTWQDSIAEGMHFAREVTFLPLGVDADPRYRGRINTRQSHRFFGQATILPIASADDVQNTEFFSWDGFVPPPTAEVRHGVLMAQDLYDEHEAIRTARGWREWTEGLDASELDENGLVKVQRLLARYALPSGSRTYFQRDTNLATAIHATINSASENEFALTAGAGETEASGMLGGGASGLLFCFTTPTDEPDSSAWPTGNVEIHSDVSIAGADVTYGYRAAGSATGHFARVNAALTSDLETKAQTEGLFSGTGIKDASTGSVSWTAGAADNRFEGLLAGTRPANHGNQNVTLTFDADGFAVGPWAAADGRRIFIT